MGGWTNKGKYKLFDWGLRNTSPPANFQVALVTVAGSVLPDTNTFSELTEIAVGNGYVAGGTVIPAGSVTFDVLTEDDTNDRGLIQIKDLVWTAAGGAIPASGSGARYAVLTDDAGSAGVREVYYGWDLASDRSVSSGQTLTLQNCELRINEV